MSTPKKIKQSSLDERTEARAAAAERRTYVRYPATLDATLVVPDGREIACLMRDFCMGGMLLQFKQPAANVPTFPLGANDVFTVQCAVPDASSSRIVQFQAHIVRNVQDGVGLAFINPDRDSLLTMQQFALQFSLEPGNDKSRGASEKRSDRKKTDPLGRRFNDILAGCGRIAQESMDSLLEQLGAKLPNRLFDLSRDATKVETQNTFYDASEVLKKDKDKLLDAIRLELQERLNAGLNNSLNPKQAQEQQVKDLSVEELTLIGDEDLGAWLAISDVTSKIEERYKESLAALEERLSVLFNAKISPANNPYGPALFAESFQAGLAQFGFKESVNSVCYAVLKEILITLLSDLYVKLNDILIGYGILPKLKLNVLRRSAHANSKAEDSAASPISDPVTETQEPRISTELSGNSVSHDEAVAADADEATAQRKSSASSRRPPPDLYQVVNDLRTLRQDLVRHKIRGSPEAFNYSSSVVELAGATPPTLDSSDYYSTSDLVAAVADLQTNADFFKLGDARLSQVKSQVLATLGARGGGESGKGLNPRDSNVMEVAGDLLGAMQSDPLVADSVKPWLKRLELPVLKLALQDPSLFFDQSHVARQVVNNIAQLEFYSQEKSGSRQSSISVAIENLLEKIAMERSDGIEIFTEIQAKLNKFIKVQEKAYAENLKDLITACQANLPIPEIHEPESEANGAQSDSELNKWMMFARRLREGDDVLYLLPDNAPLRLRVAWMDGQRTVYVFVNLQGIKEKVLKISDVARLIGRGVLEPQTNAADPAMDRAQYVIMQNLYQQVVYESTHDNLTGLINRREFERRISEAELSAKRDDLRHVLIFVDVDKFSAINNNCGYERGDKLLQDLVGMFKKNLEGKGEIARLGGDEFGILVEKCSLDDALVIAEQLLDEAANHKLAWEDNLLSVSVSIGLVPISARSGGVSELLQAAESSCSTAKSAGGNKLQVFHAGRSQNGNQNEMMKWVGKIDKILEEESLEIRCQRIQPIDGDSLSQPHFEVLVGVKDDHGNIVPPGEFIKAAEWYRRMSAVDRHVIKRTLSWMEKNHEALENIAGFSINLSGQSLNEEGFVDFILEQLESVQVPREKICFEVTETMGIVNLSDATLFIERIKDAGCRFALDDFGSGMSSYGYLKNLPVDMVKIDGVFVKNLVANSSDYAVVKSITEIAHFMKKKVVAEFVENDEALDLLREIGVDYAQGYMFDKPGSLDRLVNAQSIH